MGLDTFLTIQSIITPIGAFLLVVAVVSLPFALSSRLRPYVGIVVEWFSYALGLSVWFFGLFAVLTLWGWWAVIAGLLLFGIGVVPMGLVALALGGLWGAAWHLAWNTAVVIGARVAGRSLRTRY